MTDSHADDELDPQLCEMALADEATGRRFEVGDDPERDRLLDAYREGRLGPSERRGLEARFRREPALRRRLAERAGVSSAPPPEIRARVLADIAPARRVGLPGRWLALAAALLLAVGVTLVLQPRDLPSGVDFDLEVRGLASVREPSSSDRPAEVFPSTVVRVVARPERALPIKLELALYRSEAARLIRVADSVVTVEWHGDAATLSAEAGEVLVVGPGAHTLYLVAARPGDLPAVVSGRGGDSPAARLADGGRRRVYPFSVRLLPMAHQDPATAEGNTP